MNDVTKRRAGSTGRARSLRQEETDPEYKLWGDLKAGGLNGYKFTRQIPLGPYIADFVCRKARLIVELDGSQHSWSDTDARRTELLNAQGYSVLRFWNAEVLQERRAVLETILAALEGGLRGSDGELRFSPASTPSPPRVARHLSPVGRGGRPPSDASPGIADGIDPGKVVSSSPRRGEVSAKRTERGHL